MAKKSVECPVCGISVKVENIETHLRRVHPGREVDVDELDLPKVKKTRKAPRVPGTRTWSKWVALLIVIIVVAVVAVMLQPGEEGPEPNYAPDFQVIDVDGNTFSLNLNIGTAPILIQFFNPNGDDCKEMAPIMTNLSAHFGTSLKMVSLSERTEMEIRYFRNYYGADWVFAPTNPILYSQYGVGQLPHFVLVDKNGIIRWQESGILTLEHLIDVADDWM